VPFGAYTFPGAGPLRGVRYAAERNPSIPAALAPIVRGIAGLNDLPAARLFPPPLAPARSRVPLGRGEDARGPGGGYTPATIRRAYGVPDAGDALAAEPIAIMQFGGGYAAKDFEAFCAAYGLPVGNVSEVSIA